MSNRSLIAYRDGGPNRARIRLGLGKEVENLKIAVPSRIAALRFRTLVLHQQEIPTSSRLEYVSPDIFLHRPNMAKSKQAKAAKQREETFQQPTPPAQELSDEGSDVEFVTEAELEKDDAEEELERLVFGDGEGFRDGLRDFQLDDDEADEDGDESGSQGGLEGMDDADVC